jgi:hypothetical protein
VGQDRVPPLEDRVLTEPLVQLGDLATGAGVDPVQDRAAQRGAVGIGREGAGADPAHRDALHLVPAGLAEQLGDDRGEVAPPDALRVVLDEPGLREVGVVRPLRRGHDRAVRVRDHPLRARSTDVHTEQHVSHRCIPSIG